MKTKLNFSAQWTTLAFLLFAAGACEDVLGIRGKGDKITETRNVKDFHALEIDANATVDMRVDSVYRVEVTCEESIIDYLETVEEDGVLKVHFSRDVYDVDGLHIRVWAPNWDAIEANGSVDINAPDAISGNNLVLNLTGSGNIKVFDASFQKTDALIDGSGNLTLGGSAGTLNCIISGSGNADMLDCPAQIARVVISGSGNARLDVTEKLDVVISGSGDVEYRGNPQVNSQISGSGKVRKI
jgi:Ca2+-binding RTX toxin-like protein